MQDPAAAHLVFVTVVALGAEGFAEIWVGCSINDRTVDLRSFSP